MFKLSDVVLERGVSFTDDAVEKPRDPAATYGAMIGDAAYLARYPGETQARDAIPTRPNNVDGIFSSQVGVELQVVSVDLTGGLTAVLSATTDSSALLEELGQLRRQTPALVATGLTHLFTGRQLDGDTAASRRCILQVKMRCAAGGGTMPGELMRSTRSSIHQRLRESTHADHLRLEGALNLLDPQLTRHRYGRVLVAFHGFYAPLEAQFRRHHRAMSLTLDFELPCRTPLLMADLGVLGMSPVAHEDVTLPEIRTLPEFAGRLYVVEGAALGGQVLARHLAVTCAIHHDSGAAFFSGSGPVETGRRWVRILTWLERVARSAADSRDMVAAASATFRALDQCVEAQTAQS